MALCAHGIGAAKELLHKLTPALEGIIDKVLTFTGHIMKGSAWPLIEAALLALPAGPVLDKALHLAVDALTDAQDIINETDVSKKIQMFVDDVKKYDPLKQHAILVKIASIITALLHDNQHSESTYDTLVQVKAVTNNAEDKANTAKIAA